MEQKKINVLHFPIRNTKGGVTRSALKFWEYIDHERFQFDFATCSPKLDFEQELVDQGCKVHYISCYAEQDAKQFCHELREILLQGYDAIHINTSWWKSFYAEQVAREVGIKKIIVHAHSTFVDIQDDRQREEELLVHKKLREDFTPDLATHFLSCSRQAAFFLFGSQISQEKIRILPNAVDVKRYSYNIKKRLNMRRSLHLDKSLVIGNIGRMSYAKNQLFLVECFFEVQKKIDNAILMMIGKGELEKELRAEIKLHGLEDKVILVGEVENVEDYLQAMDIFALPSRFEGLPCVLVEAQAAGLRCIVGASVTEEAKITEHVIFVELEKEKWVNAILCYAQGYDRIKVDEQIRAAGYDIKEEIKVLEEMYAEDI